MSPPHPFVSVSGRVPPSLSSLVIDLSRVFSSVPSSTVPSHEWTWSVTARGTNSRLAVLPSGPTLTFRVEEYAGGKDVREVQRRPHEPGKEGQWPAMVVLDHFGGGEVHKQVMAATLQGMFPPIAIDTVKLAQCRRVVLFSFDAEKDVVYMRHYFIEASPVGITKTIKKIIKKQLPNMAKYEDISNYVLGNGESDSEVEADDNSKVVMPQDFGRLNQKSHQSAVRLQEIGPRLTLKLIKIEEKVGTGAVLYHAFIKKTEAEKQELDRKIREKKALKEQRRVEQQKNVEAKKSKKRPRDLNPENSASESDANHNMQSEDGFESKQASKGADEDEAPRPIKKSNSRKKKK